MTVRGGFLDAHISCPRCGEFDLSPEIMAGLNGVADGHRWKLSAYLRNYQPQTLAWRDIEGILSQRVPSLERRAVSVLRRVHHEFGPGRFFQPVADDAATPDDLQDPSWLAQGWCRDTSELLFLLREVMQKEWGWLEEVVLQYGMRPAYQLTAKGVIRIESGSPTEAAKKGFCAMWFSPQLHDVWQWVIAPAIRDAGYEAVRLDEKEYNHNIDDEIIAEIRNSRFVVADLTGHRGGVYYEAGFAHGLGIPVIFMHRNDANPDIHFDLRQYNFILWDAGQWEMARKKLQTRIVATLGQGPLPP